MNDDERMLAHLQDRAEQAADRYMITAGDFLDTHQRRLAEEYSRGGNFPVPVLFYGGYEDAERCMPVFLPDYASEEDAAQLLRVIRVRAPKAGRTLTHRDYLGSLLSLGIDRSVTGDILVRDEKAELGPGADIIVKEEMAEFIQLHYEKAGRAGLKTEILPLGELHLEEADTELRHDTVASLRLDSVVASAFRVSRAKAAEAIRRGLVSVNSREALKPDMEIREKDKIVFRGKGRLILDEAGGTTRRDRIRVCYKMFR